MSEDRRDPICGMTGVIERQGHWFCSERCIAEYEQQLKTSGRGTCEMPRRRRWFLDPWVWVPASGVLLVLLGGPISVIYRGYLSKVGVPLLAGLLIGGLIDRFVPREYIVKLLAGSRKRVIARATLLGFLASTCSHGCLALSMELYRKGASIPAVVSFLLASPWASMSLTLILLGLFGLKALWIIGGALMIAFVTGLIFQRLARRGLLESNPHTTTLAEDYSIWRDLGSRWREHQWTRQHLRDDARGVVAGMVPLGRMVLGWVQLGLLLSSVIGGLVPHGIFDRFLGPSIGGLFATLVFAAVMEVCSEGTAPLAFELYRHTGAFGNAFAFLMGGVVTDYTELGAVWSNIGRRTVLWLLAVTLPMVIVMGMLLNLWLAGQGVHAWP
jgi:uncharacterized membrane protein YraQ (UPF0718 family)